ncbi:hypothetical protein B0H17DRAFT_1154925 [Mycena rosella]|uniref:Uncharacterized protein n=1 Tax=Mycena rosella TaxID=1033263 RepID=A0AAD7F5L1_MYCRO|nr:hypothetical protein B0H17DRAFT_1154925 [Mycena rosella]
MIEGPLVQLPDSAKYFLGRFCDPYPAPTTFPYSRSGPRRVGLGLDKKMFITAFEVRQPTGYILIEFIDVAGCFKRPGLKPGSRVGPKKSQSDRNPGSGFMPGPAYYGFPFSHGHIQAELHPNYLARLPMGSSQRSLPTTVAEIISGVGYDGHGASVRLGECSPSSGVARIPHASGNMRAGEL